ncbi:2,3-bisphosphoglycerate-dependent phosphoglycerate mutase [Lactobacillus sp. PV034]|uniref:2,3-bisphosphoglycerate-dependent phosphoglycerate mutase n=1 Tax=Lactobacillus sp. PV034 TaxID=2594495 RepID=UPI00223FCFC2|nr:2,3-bisphosphoglycerate-dependent phosphoglycerate mutase [Lactobacillus sp. PV034]QNQ81394.1 2,3-bisphosphoglycerate-dependent phosphoglycerate mutase [Lactobacillus sp. PV034]
MAKLVLIRHGESTANRDNIYTGWNDVPLSPKGIEQAKAAGLKVAKIPNFVPTHIHTSVLSRAIMTAYIVADICDFLYLPITKTWRLNERHYGALRGMNKDVSRKIYGKEQVLEWRRGFDSVPPLLERPVQDRRYAKYDMHLMPRGESLHQTQQRLMPYFEEKIAPELLAGHDQLVVAHGSSLRALIKKLENISDKDIVKLEVPNAEPIVYTFDQDLKITNKEILS